MRRGAGAATAGAYIRGAVFAVAVVFVVVGAAGSLSLLGCLLVLTFLAEPPWLLTWLLTSAGTAAVGFAIGIPLLSRVRRSDPSSSGREAPVRR